MRIKWKVLWTICHHVMMYVYSGGFLLLKGSLILPLLLKCKRMSSRHKSFDPSLLTFNFILSFLLSSTCTIFSHLIQSTFHFKVINHQCKKRPVCRCTWWGFWGLLWNPENLVNKNNCWHLQQTSSRKEVLSWLSCYNTECKRKCASLGCKHRWKNARNNRPPMKFPGRRHQCETWCQTWYQVFSSAIANSTGDVCSFKHKPMASLWF